MNEFAKTRYVDYTKPIFNKKVNSQLGELEIEYVIEKNESRKSDRKKRENLRLYHI
ncbi:hypothetical protein SAMN04488511_1129 [Pedobacter suwonensis]|uniref:Uncharacterized protein n=1 Tax=Pedobacter suwonensis TaxID=332999 RepID=A0A1I0TN94_9SPHI|nr:hypothetical protein SAMN04488511_1129 [Pedobacter suwonensis]